MLQPSQRPRNNGQVWRSTNSIYPATPRTQERASKQANKAVRTIRPGIQGHLALRQLVALNGMCQQLFGCHHESSSSELVFLVSLQYRELLGNEQLLMRGLATNTVHYHIDKQSGSGDIEILLAGNHEDAN